MKAFRWLCAVTMVTPWPYKHLVQCRCAYLFNHNGMHLKCTLCIKVMTYTGSSLPPLPSGAVGYSMTNIIPTFKKLPRKQGKKMLCTPIWNHWCFLFVDMFVWPMYMSKERVQLEGVHSYNYHASCPHRGAVLDNSVLDESFC